MEQNKNNQIIRNRVIVDTNEPSIEINLKQLEIRKQIKQLINQKTKKSFFDWLYLNFED